MMFFTSRILYKFSFKLLAIPVILFSNLVFCNEKHDLQDVSYYKVPELLLSEYIKYPSVTGVEKEAGKYFAEISRKVGLHVRVFTDEIDSYNFSASLYPLDMGKPNIILLNHIDVVPAGDISLWEHPPFSGKIVDGEVWGRGAIDNKGMAIMQLLSLAKFVNIAKEEELPYNVTMLSVSNEETGGTLGAKIIVEEYLEELNPVVVFGEGGTGILGALKSDENFPFFGISIAQKRGLWFAIEASNMLSGHGSMPRNQYPNREVVMASKALLDAKPQIILTDPVKDMIREFSKYETGRRKFVLRNIRFFAPFFSKTLREDALLSAMITNTMTLTNLSSTPGADNQVASEARAVFDCRLLPHTSTEKFLDYVKDKIKDYDVTLTVIHETPDAPVSEKGVHYDNLAQAVRSAHGDVGVAPLLFLANNDNAYFRIHGIPAYGLFPAVLTEELMETIHMANERVPVQALYDGIEVYNHLIKIYMGWDDSFKLKEELSISK